MSVKQSQNTANELRQVLGKKALNALFPREFEFYMLSLELINSKGFTEDFFTFPVTPNSIKEQYQTLTNIQKTASGITVNKTDTFAPRNIIVSGNFGRQFKTIINRNLVSFTGIAFTAESGGVDGLKQNFTSQRPGEIVSAVFNRETKTGYGCLKVLESIINKSQNRDPFGFPYRLLLYNAALGNNYVVEVINFEQNQDQQSNAIWNYNIVFTAVAPVEFISEISPLSIRDGLSRENVLRSINRTTSFLSRSI